MTGRKKNIDFEKVSNQQHHNDDLSLNLQKREKIIYLIMKKFNISYNEAKQVVFKLEKKKLEGKNSAVSVQRDAKSKIKENKSDLNFKRDNPKVSYESHFDKKIITESSNVKKHEKNFEINSVNKQIQKQKDDLKEFERKQLKQQQKLERANLSNSDMDSIISDILPDYANPCVIELTDVNLTFDVDKERVDTLKEKFIRTLKQDKNKKMHIHALKDVNFKIYKGEKVGIIGYNGAGKSTLLKVISGIFAPDSGNVTIKGNISPLLSLGAGFDFNYSGRKNIYLNGSILGYDKKCLEEKMDDIIEFSELGEYIDIPIKNYSSGMLAKLGFSIATMLNPEILIIDEILGVGDVNFRRKSADKIKSLMNTGCTVILVSHSIPQIRDLCDKAIWIDNGHVNEIGEVNQVCDNYIRNAEKASKEQLENIKFTD